MRPIQVGDPVRAKFKAGKPGPRFCESWGGRGSYFPGQATAVHADGSIDVYFNDNFFEQRIRREHVVRADHHLTISVGLSTLKQP